MGLSVSPRSAVIMLAPNVRFGTKRPSITSTCSQSAPPPPPPPCPPVRAPPPAQHLLHLLRETGQVRRQDAGRDANPPSSAVCHHGLRATTMSTTVPGAAKVPAPGFCPTTVPGFAS